MKCRICGFEFDDERKACPMCGAAVLVNGKPAGSEELGWKGREFPKPMPKNEPMLWTSQDASEGFVNVPTKSDRTEIFSRPFDDRSKESDDFAEAQRRNTRAEAIEKYKSEHQFDDPQAQRILKDDDTIRPSADFQRRLDEEFARIRSLGNDKASHAQTTREEMPTIEAKIPLSPSKKMKKQERFDINSIEESIENMVAAEAKAQAESSERRRKLAAMAAAREAYFKCLDEGFFEKDYNRKYDPSRRNEPAESSAESVNPAAPAADIAPEMLAADIAPEMPAAETLKPAAPTEEQKKNCSETLKPVSSERKHLVYNEDECRLEYAEDLEELTGKLELDPEEHTVKFDKESFVAAVEAQAEVSAPEEDFVQTEETHAEHEAKESEPDEQSPQISDSENEPVLFELGATGEQFAVGFDEENNEYRTAMEYDIDALAEQADAEADNSEEALDEQRARFNAMIDAALSGESSGYDYSIPEDDDDEEEYHEKKHGFLKFILTLILIIVIAELAIFLLGKFLPDKEFTKSAVELNDAVIDAVTSFAKTAWENLSEWAENAWITVSDWVKGLFNK